MCVCVCVCVARYCSRVTVKVLFIVAVARATDYVARAASLFSHCRHAAGHLIKNYL